MRNILECWHEKTYQQFWSYGDQRLDWRSKNDPKKNKIQKKHCKLGQSMVSSSKHLGKMYTPFFASCWEVNLHLVKPLDFPRGYILTDIFHFLFYLFLLLKTWVKFTSVARNVNQRSVSLQLMLQCEFSGGLTK